MPKMDKAVYPIFGSLHSSRPERESEHRDPQAAISSKQQWYSPGGQQYRLPVKVLNFGVACTF